ncbi:MAG: hypothetical protein H3Z50_07155 [archaeon]|nr:hypothetical protein [archaeon]MCP8306667.1 hypothetical protein [archaeon]
MKYPLKNILYEKLRQQKNILDVELLDELKKEDPEITTRDLSRALMQLEIMGLISVSWVRKDARRVEIIEKTER